MNTPTTPTNPKTRKRVESNIRSIDDARRRKAERALEAQWKTRPVRPQPYAVDSDRRLNALETDVDRIFAMLRWLTRRDDTWSRLVAQLQRDMNYLMKTPKED